MAFPHPLNRRRFLGATALAGFGASVALVAGSRGAAALTFAPMPAGAKAIYDAACSGVADPYHAELVAAVVAAGEGRRETEAEIEAQLAATRCPICGCTLAQYIGPLPVGTQPPAAPKG